MDFDAQWLKTHVLT